MKQRRWRTGFWLICKRVRDTRWARIVGWKSEAPSTMQHSQLLLVIEDGGRRFAFSPYFFLQRFVACYGLDGRLRAALRCTTRKYQNRPAPTKARLMLLPIQKPAAPRNAGGATPYGSKPSR